MVLDYPRKTSMLTTMEKILRSKERWSEQTLPAAVVEGGSCRRHDLTRSCPSNRRQVRSLLNLAEPNEDVVYF